MDPIAWEILQNALAVRERLLAHAAAVWLASRALEVARAGMPPAVAPSWRGDAARQEASRVGELDDDFERVAVSLQALSARIARDTAVVSLHVA